MGGIACDGKHVIFGGRDLLDSSDSFTCLNAETGEVIWQIIYPAAGRLDYGNSPRGTPLIHNGQVFLSGAFGQVTCVNIKTGETVWNKNLPLDFGVEIPTWGFCGSPLIVKGQLILQTPSPEASLVALDSKTGDVIWQTKGSGTGYSSLVSGIINGKLMIVGYQEQLLAGWDATDGKRIWEIKPKHSGDFNVPTPIINDNSLWLISENNGLRRYSFEGELPKNTPQQQNDMLTPDSHSPVKIKERIFVLNDGLHCVNARDLSVIWKSEDLAFNVYGSIIATDTRILVTTFSGDLILADATANKYKPMGHWKLIDDGTELYSHPALAGTKLFIRLGNKISCYELANEQ